MIKRSVGQGTEQEFTKAGESTDQLWSQELDDVLSILGLNSCGKTQTNQMDYEREQRSPGAAQYDIGDATSFFESLQSSQTLSCQNQMHPVYVGKMHSTPHSGLKAHSQSKNQLLGTDQAVSSGARAVPNITDVIHNNIQPISSPSAHTTSYNRDCTAFCAQRNSKQKKQARLQVRCLKKEKTKNSSPVKRKLMGSTQCSSRLFGILSLILQAFDSPMTAELEQRCVGVMQRALEEIQNAHYIAISKNNDRG